MSKIVWSELTREEAGRLAQLQADVRAEKRHLLSVNRVTLTSRAAKLNIKSCHLYNLPELREAVLAQTFLQDADSELEKQAIREAL